MGSSGWVRSKIQNPFLADDYVRTYTDLATMERADEAARRAVNRIRCRRGDIEAGTMPDLVDVGAEVAVNTMARPEPAHARAGRPEGLRRRHGPLGELKQQRTWV